MIDWPSVLLFTVSPFEMASWGSAVYVPALRRFLEADGPPLHRVD